MTKPTKTAEEIQVQKPWHFLFSLLSVVLISSALSALSWLALTPIRTNLGVVPELPTKNSLFAKNYPANGPFQRELINLKTKHELTETHEMEIQKALMGTTDYLEIPPSLLWCLLFQESRLNHLEGIDADKPASGLGQFSRFSFFEINYQLSKFSPNTQNLLYLTFGRDIRPIAATRKDTVNPSSYYSIPTAVTASAIYLHNRYFQLSKILDKRTIYYNPDILWLFATMAYNKGSRSVLALWNSIYKKRGPENFARLLTDYNYFTSVINDSSLLTKSLRKIWEEDKARPYASELKTHTQNISSCSISPLFQTTRSLTEANP